MNFLIFGNLSKKNEMNKGAIQRGIGNVLSKFPVSKQRFF